VSCVFFVRDLNYCIQSRVMTLSVFVCLCSVEFRNVIGMVKNAVVDVGVSVGRSACSLRMMMMMMLLTIRDCRRCGE